MCTPYVQTSQSLMLSALTVKALLSITICLQVALKVISVQASPSLGISGHMDSFAKEIQLLETVSAQCEHVCRFHGFTEVKGQPALVMKLYARSLADELNMAPSV